jgi:hypothetical protein
MPLTAVWNVDSFEEVGASAVSATNPVAPSLVIH